MPSWMEVARETAELCGLSLTDETLDHVMWNQTGFPSFFDPLPGETVEAVFRCQLVEAFLESDWVLVPQEDTGGE